MKNFVFLLKRYKKTEGNSLQPLMILGTVLYAIEYIMASAGGGLILRELSDSTQYWRILIIVSCFSFCSIFYNLINSLLNRNVFAFRLKEITHLEKLAIKITPRDIESSHGNQVIIDAFDSVCSGNDYGIEIYLISFFNLIVLILTSLCYAIIMRNAPVWLMTIVFFLVILQIITDRFFNRLIIDTNEQAFNKYHNLSEWRRVLLHENVARDVRLYNCVDYLARKLKLITDEYIYYIFQKEKKVFLKFFTGQIITIIGNLLAIFLIFNIGENPGEFVLYIGFQVGITQLANQIIEMLSIIQQNEKSVNDYRNIIEKYDVDKQHFDVGDRSVREDLVVIDKMSFSYGEKTIFNNISLSFYTGEKIAIVGENGKGKTTLMKLFLGVLLPEKGTISVNGIKTTEYNESQLFNLYTISSQNAELIGFTLAENITGQIRGSENISRLECILEKTGLKEVIDKLPNGLESYCGNEYNENGVNFSGGEKQKIIMARALYKEAPIMILDEPTAALDAKAEYELYDMYSKLSENKLIFFVSHRLGTTKFCDRILFIDDSAHIYLDSFDGLYISNEKFRKMYDEQTKYYRG